MLFYYCPFSCLNVYLNRFLEGLKASEKQNICLDSDRDKYTVWFHSSTNVFHLQTRKTYDFVGAKRTFTALIRELSLVSFNLCVAMMPYKRIAQLF